MGCSNLGALYEEGRGVEKDERRAASLYEKACQGGNAGGCSNLGFLYLNGSGVERDESRAASLYEKACQGGFATGCSNLGFLYVEGRGVGRDDTEAVKWFRKAAEQGNEVAMLQLADMLKRGAGVERDPKAAQELYRRAAEKGNERARLRLASFAREQTCAKKARTALFESLLKCVGREDFRAAIKRGGAQAVRENDTYWYDKYESEDVLKGSSILSVGYTHATGEFAVAEYVFPSRLDTEQISRIRNMVASKYGAPSRSSGNTRLGPVSYEWSLPDGIRIRVHRDWPDTTTFLEYVRPETKAVLDGEIKKSDNEKRAREHKKQESAF
jgi:TPR repeat protein